MLCKRTVWRFGKVSLRPFVEVSVKVSVMSCATDRSDDTVYVAVSEGLAGKFNVSDPVHTSQLKALSTV